MLDTSAAAQERYFAQLAGQSPAQRAERLVQLTRAMLELARAGIQRQIPDATPRMLAAHLADRRYGRAVAARHFPDVFPPR